MKSLVALAIGGHAQETLPLQLGNHVQEDIAAALRRAGFVQKDAAARLGVTRRKLNYMIRKLGITHASWRRNRAPAGDDGVGGPAGPPLDSPADAH